MPEFMRRETRRPEAVFQSAAIVPAAGFGTRFSAAGSGSSKQFQHLDGLPLLVHVLRALERSSIDAVYIAAPPGRVTWVRREFVRAYGFRKVRSVVTGGSTRGESVRRCVERIPLSFDVLLVHDGARPLVTPELIDQVAEAAFDLGAALAAVPETDTIKRSRASSTPKGQSGRPGGWVRKTMERETLWRAQTPQAFRSEIFRKALRNAERTGFDGTDDASFVEQAGGRVWIVPGDERNLKVTNPEDLLLAEALWSASKGRVRGRPKNARGGQSDAAG